MSALELSHEEAGYIRALLKEHLEYYRLLAGNPRCSKKHRALHQLCEKLMLKLLPQDGTYQSLTHNHGHRSFNPVQETAAQT
jgi:hypothetical protein